jgi:hypothetical protein
VEPHNGAHYWGTVELVGVFLASKEQECGIELIQVELVRDLDSLLSEFFIDGVLFPLDIENACCIDQSPFD